MSDFIPQEKKIVFTSLKYYLPVLHRPESSHSGTFIDPSFSLLIIQLPQNVKDPRLKFFYFDIFYVDQFFSSHD